jgi:hypothetical protein
MGSNKILKGDVKGVVESKRARDHRRTGIPQFFEHEFNK